MLKNEANAAKRHIGPVPFFDLDGNLLAGLTFQTGSAEVFWSIDGAAESPASADMAEIGAGLYYYPASQGESVGDSFGSLRIHKAGYADVVFREPIIELAEIQAGLATSTALATAQGDITSIKAATDLLPIDPADESLLLGAILAIPTTPALAADLATAQSAITDIQSRIPVALDGDGNMMSSVQSIVADAIDAASVAAAAVTKIADGVFSYVIEAGAPSGARSFLQRLRIEWSVFAAKALGLAINVTVTEHFRDAADTKDRATFSLLPDGTRTPGTLDGD